MLKTSNTVIRLASRLAEVWTVKVAIDTQKEFKSPNTMMIQGCTSDAGKSVMVAGLCRVVARHGTAVAPFKPQNMALNSAVTVDGGEIGRAQAVQAQACNLQPHTDMNPILLKPSSDTGAQVIVHGHAITAMQAAEYHDYKKVAMLAVLESHTRLQANYTKVIVEGAGSPAEINLRANDIANMGFAEKVDCPVVLIADIDRGGVFAHLVGTLELLEPSEQQRVVGFIINRFRGDIGLLESGLSWLEERTGKPVIGVVPYLTDFFLDAEDAISTAQVGEQQQKFKVVVPVLSRISNHTDFDALRMHPNVDLQFVSVKHHHIEADLIILPGSKNVLGDLAALKHAGWQQTLQRHLRYGGKVIGICGGYQMLGGLISDPLAIETNLGSAQGFGLLETSTVLHPEKQLKRVSGAFINPKLNKSMVNGYEIHCGITTTTEGDSSTLIKLSNGKTDGLINQDNNVLGCYLHGLFDTPEAANALLKWAGLESNQAADLDVIREQQLERLADCLEECLDATFINSLKGH
ncbi:MAG: adenosylcobyric acid synthase [Arenicella sp.]|jgi:adenosylcobyric acid synthase